MRVVPVQLLGNVAARRAHTPIDLEVHPFVLHAAPQALNEYVVAPGATPVHGHVR